MTPDEKARLQEKQKHICWLYVAGKSQLEIAQSQGMSQQGVSHILHKHKVPMRPKHYHKDKPPLKTELMFEMHRKGDSYEKISKIFDIKITTLRKRISHFKRKWRMG